MSTFCGKGVTLHWDTTGGTTWAAVTDVVSISPPDLQLGKVESTDLQSATKEYKPTIADPGEMTVNLNWDPVNTEHAALLAKSLADQSTPPAWKITFTDTDSTEMIFSGFITNFPVSELGNEDIGKVAMTVAMTGAYTVS